MDASASASSLEVTLRQWSVSCVIATFCIGHPVFLSSPMPLCQYIQRLCFSCLCCVLLCMFFMCAPVFNIHQFCKRLFSNLAAFIRSRFVRYLLQLLFYYVAFCCIVTPISACIRWLISVLVASLFPPLPSFPSLPRPIWCYSFVSCLLLSLTAYRIMSQG